MGFKSIILVLIFFSSLASANPKLSTQLQDKIPTISSGNVLVQIKTTMGTAYAELEQKKDPITVEHFLNLVDRGYYNGLIFHRIIEGFIIQTGKYDTNLAPKPVKTRLIENQSKKTHLKNKIGTLAMAHSISDANSAKTEFFINLLDNPRLDSTRKKEGYAVFGKIVKGMDVIEKIAGIKTWEKNGILYTPFYPNEAYIKEISRVSSNITKG